MRTFKQLPRLAVCGCLLFPLAAAADLDWNGFITVGGGIADPDSGSVLGDYEDDLTFKNENVLGLQLRGSISDKLSATGQIVARGIENYQAEMAWAYLSYEATDNFTVKFGRIRTPYYLYSDFLEVGYAYQWVSPPTVVYNVPFDSTDGIDVVYETQLGKVDTSIQAYIGSFDDTFVNGGTEIDLDVRDQYGLVGTAVIDWLTLRASVHNSKARFNNWGSIPFPAPLGSFGGLAAALNSLPASLVGNSAAQAADDLLAQDVKFTYSQVAAKAELNNWLLVAEFTGLESDDGPIGDQKRGYASVGYTFGDWTVHYTYSSADDDPADLTSSIPVIAGVTDGLIQAVDGITDSFAQEFTANTVGIRYDFTSGAAFKVEYSDTDDEKAVGGGLLRFVVDAVF